MQVLTMPCLYHKIIFREHNGLALCKHANGSVSFALKICGWTLNLMENIISNKQSIHPTVKSPHVKRKLQ